MASGLPDLPSWWSEWGAAGWVPGVWLGTSQPWVVAGHALGGWSLVEPGRAPQGLPAPGVFAMHTPLVWYDSVSVTSGEGAAWHGFGAALATAVGHSGLLRRKGGRTIVDLRSGSFILDDNSLSIERGDSLNWFRGEAMSGSRGPVGSYWVTGRHLWGAAGGFSRRRHGLVGSFAQRGAASNLVGGDEQGVTGQSGTLEYRYRRGGVEAGLSYARGHDRHESFSLEEIRLPSSREAEAKVVGGEVQRTAARDLMGLRFEWRRSRVARTTPGSSFETFERRARSLWGAARYERPVGDGRLTLELGAGRHDAVEGMQAAPGLSYRFRTPSLRGRVAFERVLHPVWSDLGPDQDPFLQRTWVGVIEVAAGESGRRAGVSFLAGRTSDRALIPRLPLEDLWLRFGATADPQPYDFGLLSATGLIAGKRLSAGGDAFLLARDRSEAQPNVDPALGGRVWGALHSAAFGGDLGLTLRGEVLGVGDRETEGESEALCGEPDPDIRVPSRPLSGYVTTGASLILTLKGAVLTVRVRNLENRPRLETWVDCADVFDPGLDPEATGPGREWRFAFTAALLN